MADISAADLNNFDDSDFAYVEPGGTKDKDGKTIPRSLRHFYVGDAAHVRNALARAPQSPFGEKAMPAILAAAKKFGVKVASDGRGFDDLHVDGTETERRFLGESSRAAFQVGGVQVQVRQMPDGKKRITGYGAVFNRQSRNLGGFVEFVGNDAFSRAGLEGYPGAVARYNHDMNLLLGTIGGRTLSLRTDNVGLFYDVDPPQSRADITELVERGDVRHSSFAFRVLPGGDEWGVTDDTNYPKRTLHDLELVDVAPVVTPAYPDATAGLRSLAMRFDAGFDEVRKMAESDDLMRFFRRTDSRSGQTKVREPVKAGTFGPVAMLDLLQRRSDPWADTE